MEKKKLYYIIGGVAVIGSGVGLYLWNKNKKAVDSIESEDLKTKSAEEKIDVIKKSSKPMVKLSSIAFRPAIATATPTVELAPVKEVSKPLLPPPVPLRAVVVLRFAVLPAFRFPLKNVVPLTSKVVAGLVVPIPTLPSDLIRIFSALLVEKTKGKAVLVNISV